MEEREQKVEQGRGGILGVHQRGAHGASRLSLSLPQISLEPRNQPGSRELACNTSSIFFWRDYVRKGGGERGSGAQGGCALGLGRLEKATMLASPRNPRWLRVSGVIVGTTIEITL